MVSLICGILKKLTVKIETNSDTQNKVMIVRWEGY